MAIYNGTNGNDEIRDGLNNGIIVDDELYGFDGDDRLLSASGNDKLFGGNGADTMIADGLGVTYMEGGAGRDAMFAGGGNDTAFGGEDSDSIDGGDGNDMLYGENGIDFVSGGNGNDLIVGGNGDDYSGLGGGLYGGEGNDTMDGGEGLDLLNGDNGDDLISGGLGKDFMDGGNGNDTVDYRFAVLGGSINLLLQKALIDGVEEFFYSFENAYGSQGNDTITGSDIANRLWGENGHDILDGGLGADQLVGGTGDDTYWVDDAGDTVTESVGAGVDVIQSAITLTLSANVENLTLLGFANINGTGNTLNNQIIGNGAANTLSGGNGNDTLKGGGGNDLIIGGLGTDALSGEGGIDTVDYRFSGVGGSVNLNSQQAQIDGVLESITDFENAYGSQGNDVITGSVVANRLWGENGNDTLDGGLAADQMAGGLGNDSYVVEDVGDTVVEEANAGVDLIRSSITLTLGANLENLTLLGLANINGMGNALNNVMTGNNAANILSGESGDDTLNGGAGDDLITGGLGADAMNGGDGIDTVDYRFSAVGGSINLINQLALIDGIQEALVSFENAYGSQGTDNITGSSAANLLWGESGNDTINGGGGDDQISGGLGKDVMDGGDGNDTIDYRFGTLGGTINLANQSAKIDGVLETLVSFENAYGSSGNDVITGSDGDNKLWGLGGNDSLIGGNGADDMAGHEGDDIYRFDNVGDKASEAVNNGIDLIQSTVTVTLGENIENLTLLNFISTDRASYPNGTGNSLDNIIEGNSHRNILSGLNGNDRLFGKVGSDTLNGGDGNDALTGGEGRDTLVGGFGNDQFVFDSALGNANVDTMKDFNPTDDTIQLDNAIFTRFKVMGPISKGRIVSGANAAAADANDNLIYNTDTGALSYDADGNGASAAIQFVTLTGILALTASDFWVV